MDIDGMGELEIRKPFLALSSPEWTFLDIPEGLWMVGRVGTELST
jgi:hypothetical protein